MIFQDFWRALGQLGDPRFVRVLALGIGLALLLLIGANIGFWTLVQWLTPESITLPFIGEIGGVDTALAWGSVGVLLLASIFLMTPVASVMSGFFLESVADAVEDRHYPHLPPATPVPFATVLHETAVFLAIMIAANLVALVLYVITGPLGPFIFWAVNGLLLGREYFILVALRRLPRPQALALLRRHWLQIWIAGALMAAPLTLPIINLLVPVLGIATFTHLFQRLNGAR